MSKIMLILISLLCWNPVFADKQETDDAILVNTIEEYERLKEKNDTRAENQLTGISNMYTDAVKQYSNQMYNQARKDAVKTYNRAHSDLRRMWNGKPSEKRVPNYFIKKFINNKISQKSLDTLILALSGVNAVSDCDHVKLAPLEGSKLSKLAPPLHGEAYEKVNGLGKVSNGYVEPHSHHFFKAASVIYVLGIMKQQHLYDYKVNYLRQIKNQGDESYQEKMLKVNIELNIAAKHYVEKQIELKKLYKKMISSAAKMAEDETSSKATRVAYRGKRRDKAKKEYQKKKKRAHLSDHAARDAVKAYEIHRVRKYEHEVSQVHTHIGCDVLKDTESTTSINLLDLLIPRAYASVEETDPLFKYYLEMSEEQNKTTNSSMRNPENRVKFLITNSIETINLDISDVTPSLTEFESNIGKLQNVYDKFTEYEGESVATSEAKKSKALDAGTPQFKGIGTNLTAVVTKDSAAAFGNFDAGTAEGNLGNAGSFKNAFARLAKADDKMRRVDYKNPDGTAKESYLLAPDVPTLEEIKKKALEDLTDAEKLALNAAFKGKFGSAPKVEAGEETEATEDVKKEQVAAVTKNTRKSLNLPDIDDDPALKLLKRKPKLVKLKKDEEVDVVNPESLKALEEGATDINDDRETTLWVIISNRYVRSGFERLLEKK